MELNVNKCSVISFSRKKRSYSFQYLLVWSLCQRVDEVEGLGVILTSSLMWDKWVLTCTSKNLQALGFVLWTTMSFNEITPLKSLFCAFVLPHQEFGCIVWLPHQDYWLPDEEWTDSSVWLEWDWVQSIAMYRCFDIGNFLGILPLEFRLAVQDIMFFFKLVNDQIDFSRLLE